MSVREIVNEFNTIMSIKSIIIQLNSAVTLYEHISEDIDVESDLISGFSSTLSTMFQDLSSRRDFGFQTFQTSGLQITIHILETSSIFIISELSFPQYMMNQISLSHSEIESRFLGEVGSNDTGFIELPKELIESIFDKHEFKSILLHQISIIREEFDTTRRGMDQESIYARLLNSIDNFLKVDENKISFKIPSMVEFLVNEGYSTRDISRISTFLVKKNLIKRT